MLIVKTKHPKELEIWQDILEAPAEHFLDIFGGCVTFGTDLGSLICTISKHLSCNKFRTYDEN